MLRNWGSNKYSERKTRDFSRALPAELFEQVQSFVQENYIDEEGFEQEVLQAASFFGDTCESMSVAASCSSAPAAMDEVFVRERRLEDAVNQTEETFAEALLRHIDERGLSDPDVYKRAQMDRKLFSKIRKNPNYQPSKKTAIALALALELNLDETKDLLARAGYALSHANKADLIVEFFIEHKQYDLMMIDEALYAFDQPLLCSY